MQEHHYTTGGCRLRDTPRKREKWSNCLGLLWLLLFCVSMNRLVMVFGADQPTSAGLTARASARWSPHPLAPRWQRSIDGQQLGAILGKVANIKWCPQWCREVPTMVPYSSPRSVTVGIVLHRNDDRTPDFVSKDRRRKPQGSWSLRRQFARHCIDLHRFASKVRETGVEPARVSPLDPKCRKFTFLLHRAHRTFGWQPLVWQ